jgi:hypothetical protein
MIETGLSLIGLLLTGIGAFIAARAVIISEEQAEELSGTYVVANVALYKALPAQSRAARGPSRGDTSAAGPAASPR